MMSTLRKALRIVALTAVAIGAHALSAQAKTVVVGPTSCNPGPAHFSTIQAAIDSVAVSAPGSTVLVCAGTYPEQVVITGPVILKGIAFGTAGASVITVPPGGLVANVTTPLYGPVAAMLAVQNTSNVTVRNLTIDGAGSTCPADANRVVGIELTNLGDSTWSSGAAIVDNSVVRNLAPCDLAEGIDSEYSAVTINANELHNIGRNCIALTGGLMSVTNNRIQNCHVDGILMTDGGSTSLIQGNTVYAARGIELGGTTTNVKVTSNVIGPFVGIGILLVQVSNIQVNNNQVNASYAGIWMFKGSGTNVINNTIANAQYGLVNEAPLGGNINSMTGNTVNEALIGMVLYQVDGSGDFVAPNNLYNCVTTISPTF